MAERIVLQIFHIYMYQYSYIYVAEYEVEVLNRYS